MNDKNMAQIIGANINKLKDRLGLNNEQLGEILGVTRQTVGNYIRGDQVIDSARLFRLAKATNVSLKYFVEESDKTFSYIFRADNPKDNVDEAFLNFLNTKLNSYWDVISLANETKITYLPEAYQLETEGNNLSVEDKEIIKMVADKLRKSFGIEGDLNVDIYSVLERNNIHIYSFEYHDRKIDALSVYAEDKGAFILLNDHKVVPEERKIFSVVHELGHIIFHRNEYLKSTQDLAYSNYQKNVNEKIANLFASYFLIPRNILKDYKFYFKNNRFFSLKELIKLKREFGVSAQAMLLALKEEKYISGQIYGYLLKQLKQSGYEINEPSPIEPFEKNQKLQILLKDLYLKEEITVNKVAEVLNIDNRTTRILTKDWAINGYPEN